MLIVGLISGTSADGVDAALCEISGSPPSLHVRVLQSLTLENPPALKQRIHANCIPAQSRVDDLCVLNFELGEMFAQAALKLIAQAGLSPQDVDLVGSAGQTVWHEVQNRTVKATLQLAEGAVIAERTGITTISNVRTRDVAAGGQGAPLVSYADWLLFRHETAWRAIQNIGGIGNVTFLPPLSDKTRIPLAFDTGPGNVLIDSVVAIMSHRAQTYDHDGLLAARGTVRNDWLNTLLTHPYYHLPPPKTTGREMFTTDMAQTLLDEGHAQGFSVEDIIATLTQLTADTIADSYARFAPAPVEEVIIGGGGGRNPILMRMLRERLHPCKVLLHEGIGMNSDHKEAMVFALLAYETWHARPGVLASLTGARHSTVLGCITPGANYEHLIRKTWTVEKNADHANGTT
jgi:anhydro-N-acetylmuramic acid kinase